MSRGMAVTVIAAPSLLLLVGVGWVAALVWAFIAVIAVLCVWLLGRAQDTADEHGIYRIGPD